MLDSFWVFLLHFLIVLILHVIMISSIPLKKSTLLMAYQPSRII